jgi:hypothetical protein
MRKVKIKISEIIIWTIDGMRHDRPLQYLFFNKVLKACMKFFNSDFLAIIIIHITVVRTHGYTKGRVHESLMVLYK